MHFEPLGIGKHKIVWSDEISEEQGLSEFELARRARWWGHKLNEVFGCSPL